MTARSQEGCSGAPESGSPPYGHRREANATDREIRVLMPDRPPTLTPGAARVLLRILVKCRDRLVRDREENG
jgi:hypothetical protein